MASIYYNKLVRDRIPQIIRDSGKSCQTRILDEEEYVKLLEKKLSEELSEYLEDKNREELADLLEVMMALAEAKGWGWEEIERLRREKKENRGGFSQRILLQSVTKED